MCAAAAHMVSPSHIHTAIQHAVCSMEQCHSLNKGTWCVKSLYLFLFLFVYISFYLFKIIIGY